MIAAAILLQAAFGYVQPIRVGAAMTAAAMQMPTTAAPQIQLPQIEGEGPARARSVTIRRGAQTSIYKLPEDSTAKSASR